jgi:hypothetical protein
MTPEQIAARLPAIAGRLRTMAAGLRALADARHIGPHPQFSRHVAREAKVQVAAERLNGGGKATVRKGQE